MLNSRIEPIGSVENQTCGLFISTYPDKLPAQGSESDGMFVLWREAQGYVLIWMEFDESIRVLHLTSGYFNYQRQYDSSMMKPTLGIDA
jgi:hypothetical protein